GVAVIGAVALADDLRTLLVDDRERADDAEVLAHDALVVGLVLGRVQVVVHEVEVELAAAHPALAVLVGEEGLCAVSGPLEDARDRTARRRHVAEADLAGRQPGVERSAGVGPARRLATAP